MNELGDWPESLQGLLRTMTTPWAQSHSHTWSLGNRVYLGSWALCVSHQPIWRGLGLWPTRSAVPLPAGACSALPGNEDWASEAWFGGSEEGGWSIVKHRWPFWQLSLGLGKV